MRTLTVSGTALVLGCLALAGCAPTPTEGGPVPPDSDAAAVNGPIPLFSTGCEDLIELAVVQETLGSVEAGIDPVRIPGGSWSLSHIGLAQAGALECYWGDDGAPQDDYARYLSVVVLPDAAQAWEVQQPELAAWSKPFAEHGDAAFSNCAGSANYLYCKYDVLVGTSWLHAEVMNLGTLEDAAPIIRTLTDSVAAADPVEATWSPTGALPARCADWLSAAEINTALGMDGIAEREFPLSMPIILNDGFGDGLACSWSNPYSSAQAMPIQVVALPDAEWAWEAAWTKPRPERSPSAPLEGVGDQAYAGCATDQDVCFVDVLADGLWIAVDGNKEAGIEGLQHIAVAALAKLAA
ncbi:MAG TPA: hypothetical protein VFT01_08405 [Homoserinimonas sp.]|nr:hypothetical protein [Homoserinimonas sp.]